MVLLHNVLSAVKTNLVKSVDREKYNNIKSHLDATIIIILIISIRSTCFGRYFRPSSGELDCVYSLWYKAPTMLPPGTQFHRIQVTSRQHRQCFFTTSCKHSLVLLRMGEIIARNLLSWLKLLIKLLLLHLVGCLYYCSNDARSHKRQTEKNTFVCLVTTAITHHKTKKCASNFGSSFRMMGRSEVPNTVQIMVTMLGRYCSFLLDR